MPLAVVELMGAWLHATVEDECVRHILDELDAGRGGWVETMNVDHLRRFVRDPEFRARCEQAQLVVADGMPLVWASRLQGTPLPARVAGSDLVWSLSAGAAERGRSVWLLGGAPGTAERSARVLTERYARLRVAGTLCPAPGFEARADEGDALAATLGAAVPDIVYVGLPAPIALALIARLRAALPRTWWLTAGVAFSFVDGTLPRAAPWLRRAGGEWLRRLAQEPRRLGRRYLLEDLPFALWLLGAAVGQRCWRSATLWRARASAVWYAVRPRRRRRPLAPVPISVRELGAGDPDTPGLPHLGSASARRALLAAQARGELSALVAWRDDVPVAQALVRWLGPRDRAVAATLPHCPEICALHVVPELRSHGLGTLLLERCETLAGERGCAQVGLACSVLNAPALALYSRLGYRRSGLREHVDRHMAPGRRGGEREIVELCTFLIKPLSGVAAR